MRKPDFCLCKNKGADRVTQSDRVGTPEARFSCVAAQIIAPCFVTGTNYFTIFIIKSVENDTHSVFLSE